MYIVDNSQHDQTISPALLNCIQRLASETPPPQTNGEDVVMSDATDNPAIPGMIRSLSRVRISFSPLRHFNLHTDVFFFPLLLCFDMLPLRLSIINEPSHHLILLLHSLLALHFIRTYWQNLEGGTQDQKECSVSRASPDLCRRLRLRLTHLHHRSPRPSRPPLRRGL